MKRSEHLFQFDAMRITASAAAEAEYHEGRVGYWRERETEAAEKVRSSIGARLEQHAVTGGNAWQAVIDYGDPDAWTELQLATRKIAAHRELADRFRTDERVYGSQGSRVYELDADDVHHFRLGGQPRED